MRREDEGEIWGELIGHQCHPAIELILRATTSVACIYSKANLDDVVVGTQEIECSKAEVMSSTKQDCCMKRHTPLQMLRVGKMIDTMLNICHPAQLVPHLQWQVTSSLSWMQEIMQELWFGWLPTDQGLTAAMYSAVKPANETFDTELPVQLKTSWHIRNTARASKSRDFTGLATVYSVCPAQ